MTNYQSNSNAAKEQQKKKKNLKPVISGAKTQKKGFLDRMKESFLPDMEDAKTYIFKDVIVPSVKNTIINSVEYMFGGEPQSKNSSRTSYRGYYEKKDRGRASTNSSVFRYDDVVLRTRGDAEAVLQAMDDILREYPVVSVADLYELADTPTDNWAANKNGWTDIR